MKFKNQELLLNNLTVDNWDTYILKDGCKLGEAIEFLPAGMINKNVTGIGATTLEIISPRHSIIVEPLRSIAFSKVQKHRNCCYVGGLKGKKRTSFREIISYYYSDVEFKKFIVVADSLPRLLNILGVERKKEFFLMIDEIDSFQLDSSFRASLENCLDIYKEFPKDKRALVTSTVLEFSDPDLKHEKLYAFDYENKKRRNINLYYSENIKGAFIDKIAQKLSEKPDDKFLIAYNTVEGCKAMAWHLVNDYKILKENIKIYCSPKRQDDVSDFYAELEGGNIVGRINFMTSAYFVGVDIEDRYHSIAICHKTMKQTLLSLSRLKQIAGRGRNGVLSETIFYDVTHFLAEDQIPEAVLIASALVKITALECIIKNYKADHLLEKSVLDIRNTIIGKDDVFGYNLVRTNIYDELAISYFNIDSCLETMYTSKVLYSDIQTLQRHLEADGHKVELDIIDSETGVVLKMEDTAQAKLIGDAILKLQELDRPEDVKYLILKSRSKIQLIIYERFRELSPYYKDLTRLLEKLKELSKKNDKAYKLFERKLWFTTGNNLLRKHADELFPVGIELTNKEILERLNKVYALSNMNFIIESPTAAIQVINSLYVIKKSRKRLKDGSPLHTVQGYHKLPD